MPLVITPRCGSCLDLSPGYDGTLAFRDDHEAALLRAEALERELAETRSNMSDKERQLAEMREALDDAREDLAERDAREEPATEARARLDAVVENAERARKERNAEAAEDSERKRRRALARASLAERIRVLRSMMWAGELFYPFALLAFSPFFAFFIGGWLQRATGAGPWIYVAGGLAIPFAALIVPIAYGLAKLAWMRRWSRSLPYELRGYPDVLRIKPRRRDVDDLIAAEGHVTLRLTLCFSGAPPGDLDEIVRSFDDQLRSSGSGHWRRDSPVTEQRSKHGSRFDNADTNWKVHRWVRRLHRDVLRDLHRVSPLTSVTVTLS